MAGSWETYATSITCCHTCRHAFHLRCLMALGLTWYFFYGRLCALRTRVWSGAVKREAMEPFTSQRLCWNQQKKTSMRFWGRTGGSSKSPAMVELKMLVSNRLSLYFPHPAFIFSVLQDLFVPDGSCWLDWPAETGGGFHPVCPKR